MTKLAVNAQVNLYQFPELINDNTHKEVTIGDLHGNTIKLLHFLLQEGVLKYKNDRDANREFEGFVLFYEQCHELQLHWKDKINAEKKLELINSRPKNKEEEEKYLIKHVLGNPEQLPARIRNLTQTIEDAESAIKNAPFAVKQIPQLMSSFIDALEPNQQLKLVRLIGDEVADRGCNDYFTLVLLKLLDTSQIPLHINVSNHGDAFIQAYENDWTISNSIEGEQMQSLSVGLALLLELGIIAKADINQMVENHYKPHLLALDYTLDENGITLFSHAPIRFDRIQLLAQRLDVAYDDSSTHALAFSIERINFSFQKYVEKNKISYLTRIDHLKERRDELTDAEASSHPLLDILWHRWNEQLDNDEEARPAIVNNYQVSYVHGHDNFTSRNAHVINLDTPSGKNIKDRQRINDLEQFLADPDLEQPLKNNYSMKLMAMKAYKVLTSDEVQLTKKQKALPLILEKIEFLNNARRQDSSKNLHGFRRNSARAFLEACQKVDLNKLPSGTTLFAQTDLAKLQEYKENIVTAKEIGGYSTHTFTFHKTDRQGIENLADNLIDTLSQVSLLDSINSSNIMNHPTH